MKKGSTALFALVVIVALFAIIFCVYFYNRYQFSQKTNSDLQKKMAVEKAAMENKYCAKGLVYENVLQNYKVCYPNDWNVQTLTESKDNVLFTGTQDSTKHEINISTSASDMEKALTRLASDVYVDTTDRNFSVNNVKAFQVTGTVKPDMKKAITVFTKGGKTYEIVLVGSADASYMDYLELYKQVVNSFTFLH